MCCTYPNKQMESLFESNMQIDRILTGLDLYVGHKIVSEEMLLISNEIQEVPKVLASLKYFNKNAPEYQIICAGSL